MQICDVFSYFGVSVLLEWELEIVCLIFCGYLLKVMVECLVILLEMIKVYWCYLYVKLDIFL